MVLAESARLVDTSSHTMANRMVARSLEELLQQTSLFRPFPLLITSLMASMWGLCALSLISPAFTAPDPAIMGNFTLRTIQEELYVAPSAAELTTSVYFTGNFVLGQLFALLADHLGRRPILLASLMLTGISGCVGSAASTFPQLLVARFFQGSCFTPLTTVNYVLATECLPKTWQSVASILFGVWWVGGYCALAPLAISFHHWRQLQLLTAAPNLVLAAILFVILPESVAFSVEKGDQNAVRNWIRWNEKWSCREIPHDISRIMEHRENGSDEKVGSFEMLRKIWNDSKIRRNVIIETIIWTFTFFVYCALALTSTSAGGTDPVTSFLFSGIVELPAYLILPIVLKWTNRRPLRTACYSIGVIANFLACFLCEESLTHIIVWLVAKFSAACCYLLCFVYASELFPTFCRSCCVGICSTMYNLGAIASPIVIQMNTMLPHSQFLCLASIGILCIVLSRFQPETKDK